MSKIIKDIFCLLFIFSSMPSSSGSGRMAPSHGGYNYSMHDNNRSGIIYDNFEDHDGGHYYSSDYSYESEERRSGTVAPVPSADAVCGGVDRRRYQSESYDCYNRFRSRRDPDFCYDCYEQNKYGWKETMADIAPYAFQFAATGLSAYLGYKGLKHASNNQLAGIQTAIIRKNKLIHFDTYGFSNIEKKESLKKKMK